MNLWQRLSRLTKLPEFEKFYTQYADQPLLLEAVKLGDEALLKNEYETWRSTELEAKPVHVLRLLAVSYGIANAPKMGKDLLLLKIREAQSRPPKVETIVRDKLKGL